MDTDDFGQKRSLYLNYDNKINNNSRVFSINISYKRGTKQLIWEMEKEHMDMYI